MEGGGGVAAPGESGYTCKSRHKFVELSLSENIFAVGDVHGCAEELQQLVELLPLQAGATLVCLGDYVDRGPDSRGVIDYLLQLEKRRPVVLLKGNHESMFLDFVQAPHSKRAGMFIFNGGSATLASYADSNGHYHIPDDHLQFLRRLKLFHESRHHFFVHAGVPEIPLEEVDPIKQEATLLWTRKKFLKSAYRWSKLIVHGHTRVPEVEVRRNRVNLDTACAYGGKLSAMQFPSKRVYSVARHNHNKRVFLKDSSSRRAALRFDGALDVTVLQGQRVLHFETLNYSELGMFMRDVSMSGIRLADNEIIKGAVGNRDTGRVPFVGRIVRSKRHDDGIYYAVQIYPDKSVVPPEHRRF